MPPLALTSLLASDPRRLRIPRLTSPDIPSVLGFAPHVRAAVVGLGPHIVAVHAFSEDWVIDHAAALDAL